MVENLDWHPSIPDLEKLLSMFNVPPEFMEERETSVTHAFGGRTAEEGLERE